MNILGVTIPSVIVWTGVVIFVSLAILGLGQIVSAPMMSPHTPPQAGK